METTNPRPASTRKPKSLASVTPADVEYLRLIARNLNRIGATLQRSDDGVLRIAREEATPTELAAEFRSAATRLYTISRRAGR